MKVQEPLELQVCIVCVPLFDFECYFCIKYSISDNLPLIESQRYDYINS